MKELRIGHLSTAYHTAFILMGGRWVQEKMKVKADWSLFPTGPAMVQAFQKGELDIGYIGLPPAMIGMEHGYGILNMVMINIIYIMILSLYKMAMY